MSAGNFTQEIFTDDKSIGNGKPTAYQRSLSKLHLPGINTHFIFFSENVLLLGIWPYNNLHTLC